MPRRPILYEVHTRCWLRDLSDRAGHPIDLANVPSTEITEWVSAGFTHVWLMGVWATGPRARQCFLDLPGTRAHLNEALPDWSDSDVLGSAYAVADYRVAEHLGGNEALEIFRQRLHEAGLRLILDFIPNHVGLDHVWVTQRPDLLVTSATAQPGTFRQMTATGERWIAHGRDPHFPPWLDTAQIDIRRASARAELIRILRQVADMCDGVRCDMTMLLLNSVFKKTWSSFAEPSDMPREEFWPEAIAAVARPEFLFLAEAYWDLEEQLLELGFNYVYDKRVLDWIVEPAPARLQTHLSQRAKLLVPRGVHFLENHDELRIASRLNQEGHKLAAMLCLGLPGLPMIHEGQMSGARVRASVHLGRRWRETPDTEVVRFYKDLLRAVKNSAVGSKNGMGRILTTTEASEGRGSSTAVCWTDSGDEMALIWVNPGGKAEKVTWELPDDVSASARWDIFNALAEPPARRQQIAAHARRLELEIEPRTGLFLVLRPVK